MPLPQICACIRMLQLCRKTCLQVLSLGSPLVVTQHQLVLSSHGWVHGPWGPQAGREQKRACWEAGWRLSCVEESRLPQGRLKEDLGREGGHKPPWRAFCPYMEVHEPVHEGVAPLQGCPFTCGKGLVSRASPSKQQAAAMVVRQHRIGLWESLTVSAV